MIDPIKPIVLGLTVILATAQPALGQYNQNDLLAGLDSIGARVGLTWDEDLPLDERATGSRLQAVFELELRAHGIPVAREHSPELVLSLILSYSGSSLVAYSPDSFLVEWVAPTRYGVEDTVLAYSSTWDGRKGVGIARQEDLLQTLEARVREGAQEFATAWLAANPR